MYFAKWDDSLDFFNDGHVPPGTFSYAHGTDLAQLAGKVTYGLDGPPGQVDRLAIPEGLAGVDEANELVAPYGGLVRFAEIPDERLAAVTFTADPALDLSLAMDADWVDRHDVDSMAKALGLEVLIEPAPGLGDYWSARLVFGADRPGNDPADELDALARQYDLSQGGLVETREVVIDDPAVAAQLGTDSVWVASRRDGLVLDRPADDLADKLEYRAAGVGITRRDAFLDHAHRPTVDGVIDRADREVLASRARLGEARWKTGRDHGSGHDFDEQRLLTRRCRPERGSREMAMA